MIDQRRNGAFGWARSEQIGLGQNGAIGMARGVAPILGFDP